MEALMHLGYDNINGGFSGLVQVMKTFGRRRGDGKVRIEGPTTVSFDSPTRRVLFNDSRDANPFFHLYEALWMLCGRDDVEPLAFYLRRMRDYSDDGRMLNGAYGHRWRAITVACAECGGSGFDPEPAGSCRGVMQHGDCPVCGGIGRDSVDQIDALLSLLREDPTTDKAVLQMWSVENDLLSLNSKDVCATLSAVFSLREGSIDTTTEQNKVWRTHKPVRFLDLTVTSRSTDLVWGMFGSNYVCFTVLQEYMAARLGASVGKYHHFTCDLHAYEDNWNPDGWAKGHSDPYMESTMRPMRLVPLVSDPERFDEEVKHLVEAHSKERNTEHMRHAYSEPFIERVAYPMMFAHQMFKKGNMGVAMSLVSTIKAEDWASACNNYLMRRAEK